MASELEKNFDEFSTRFTSELELVSKKLATNRANFLDSYARIASLSAWRQYHLKSRISPAALDFFIEAQNDALTSHAFARLGCWRSACQALRGFIENTLFCLYYMDHPVELALWKTNSFRIGFNAIHKYLESHPAIASVSKLLNGLEGVASEYKTLSRAVHAYASFRMTGTTHGTQLWTADKTALGAWERREIRTIGAVNMLLVSIFREDLEGAKLPLLRQAVAKCVPATKHAQYKAELRITLV